MNFKRILWLITTSLILTALPNVGWTRSLSTATVIFVNDGDTLQVQENDSFYSVRLACIDAPEKMQPGGRQATIRLRELLPENTPVQLRIVAEEPSQVVAEVLKDGQSINLQLVQDGMAVIYPRYFQPCRSQEQQYLQAQDRAKHQQKGLWAQSKPLMPWEWRQRKRSPVKPDAGEIVLNWLKPLLG